MKIRTMQFICYGAVVLSIVAGSLVFPLDGGRVMAFVGGMIVAIAAEVVLPQFMGSPRGDGPESDMG